MNKFRDDPVAFAKAMFGIDLWSTQQEIVRSTVTERRTAVKAAHSTGKTLASAIAALYFAARYRNSRVITLSPGWLQTRSVVWAQLHSLLANARHQLPSTNVTQTEIRLGPDNLIIGLSSNQPERLQGHHAAHVLIIADEAPGIDESFWPAVEGILASGDSHLLVTGNPVVSAGYFYNCFSRQAASWRRFSISAFDTPNLQLSSAEGLKKLSLDELLKLPDKELDNNTCPYLTTRRWVKERFGDWYFGSASNSPLWQARVCGEFPSAALNGLFALEWLEAAWRPAIDNGGELIIGVDPAGPGKDLTAAVACSGGAIIDSMVSAASDSTGDVLQFLRKHEQRIRLVRVDIIGLGYLFEKYIREAGYLTVGVNVASKSDDAEKFVNLKAQRYWRLRERFQAGEISGLTNEMLSELAPTNWLINPKGQIEVEAKAEVRSAIGHSPDLAEALMLALGEGPPVPYEYRSIPRGPGVSLGATPLGHYHRNANDCGTCLAEREDYNDIRTSRSPWVRVFGSTRGIGRVFP